MPAAGAVFTHEGHHEMDAAIMDGRNRAAGAVAGACAVQNPIRAARLVMEQTEHVLLAYPGADELAREHGLPMQPAEYFFTQHRYDQLQEALQRRPHAPRPLAGPGPTAVGARTRKRKWAPWGPWPATSTATWPPPPAPAA